MSIIVLSGPRRNPLPRLLAHAHVRTAHAGGAHIGITSRNHDITHTELNDKHSFQRSMKGLGHCSTQKREGEA
eukprot:352193-Chlamydomonas_euryale.AAC.6